MTSATVRRPISAARRFAVVLALAAVAAACGAPGPSPSALPDCPTAAPTAAEATAELEDVGTAEVATTRGTFTIELYGRQAPIATANFVRLARCGFYDGIAFHRVLAGFVIQAGDPSTRAERDQWDLNVIGSGTPGYRFVIEPPARDLEYNRYTVAMANAAPAVPDSNGSQFFIALDDLDARLERNYTIFGLVIDGTDVVDAIAGVPVDSPATGVPDERIAIESITIGPPDG